MSVAFQAAHQDLLEKALKTLGWQYSATKGYVVIADRQYGQFQINLLTGQATIRSEQQTKLNELKQAYSGEAIKSLSVNPKNRWQIKSKSPLKGTLRKVCL
jgi:hypothetical protein